MHRSVTKGFNLRKDLLIFTVFIVILTGCSQTYKPSTRPYYAYPPPAPSITESSVTKTPPADVQSTSQPLSSSSIVEKTLEDSTSATQSKAKEETPRITKSKSPKENPQIIASSKLVDNARQLRVNGRVEEAIRTLERAIELDAYNGEAFYELALCWQVKKDFRKALNFADRAEQTFAGNPEKLKKVYILKAQILEASGKKDEAHKYRQKVRK